MFDYYLMPDGSFDGWTASPSFNEVNFDSRSMSMNEVTVATPSTASITFWMNALATGGYPVMLCGPSGTGKTQTVKGLLQGLEPDKGLSATINLNLRSSCSGTLSAIKSRLKRQTASLLAPPDEATMVYFIDDLNLPEREMYGAQPPLELLRQLLEYSLWYEPVTFSLMTIVNCQYITAMNPKIGSLAVSPRLQRWFTTFAQAMPDLASLSTIYQTFLAGHYVSNGFEEGIVNMIPSLINGTLAVHKDVTATFHKTVANFHYEFNIRHLAGVFAGLLMAKPQRFTTAEAVVSLWCHECERVYGDRLVSYEHLDQFNGILAMQAKQAFASYDTGKFYPAGPATPAQDPLIFAHFGDGIGAEPIYNRIADMPTLSGLLEAGLKSYNATNVQMDLVLFEDAMRHVCKIARIISSPAGHALLVGVGGSGKRSLSRLAAHLCGHCAMAIQTSPDYGIREFKVDLQAVCRKAGLDQVGVVFLFTDDQIVDDKFLVYLSDLLISGDVADLYAPDEKAAVCKEVMAKASGASGAQLTSASAYRYFISQVRRNVHVIFCCSPIGSSLRDRCGKFPALVNCTVIDWFQPWPEEAFAQLAAHFLPAEMELEGEQARTGILKLLPAALEHVNSTCGKEIPNERSLTVYTTPTSYLEMLSLYKKLLCGARAKADRSTSRLSSGMQLLGACLRIAGEQRAKLTLQMNELSTATDEAAGPGAEMKNARARLDNAESLLNALSSENQRWDEGLRKVQASRVNLAGDALMAALFLTYAGPFTRRYRDELVTNWLATSRDLKIPMSNPGEPLKVLCTDIEIAKWNEQGLHSDQISIENGAIVCCSDRWPLIVDPQLQGVAWVKNMAGSDTSRPLLVVEIQRVREQMLDVSTAVANGTPVLVENIGETIDVGLWPLIARATTVRDSKQYVRLGNNEVELHEDFKLYLTTKLRNPHYSPEIQTACVMVRFGLTPANLEQQLLSDIVRVDRPVITSQRAETVRKRQELELKTVTLEDGILTRIAEAEGDITEDHDLVEGLERTKELLEKIEKQVHTGNKSAEQLEKTWETYRAVARRGAQLFFVVAELMTIHAFYEHSLSAFVAVVLSAVSAAPDGEKTTESRTARLVDQITLATWKYIRRGLFEKHKLFVATYLVFKIQMADGRMDERLVKCTLLNAANQSASVPKALESCMPLAAWQRLCHVCAELESLLPQCVGVAGEAVNCATEWEAWVTSAEPETLALPGSLASLSSQQRLPFVRALRPDRLTVALTQYLTESEGSEYVDKSPSTSLETTYEESSAATPILFILTSGDGAVDPTRTVESWGQSLGMTRANGLFASFSMAQGQDVLAEAALTAMASEGGWVYLQNLHDYLSWLPTLESTLTKCTEGADERFRCFLTTEVTQDFSVRLVTGCIKVVMEGPADFKSRMLRAWDHVVDDSTFEVVENELGQGRSRTFSMCLFALCFYHSVLIGRQKYVGHSPPLASPPPGTPPPSPSTPHLGTARGATT